MAPHPNPCGCSSTSRLQDFDEWPDEFLLLGVAEEEAEAASSPEASPDTETTTTTDEEGEGSTDETEETEDEDDAWPIEMLIGYEG